MLKQNANEGCNSCASLAGLVLSFTACFILLVCDRSFSAICVIGTFLAFCPTLKYFIQPVLCIVIASLLLLVDVSRTFVANWHLTSL